MQTATITNISENLGPPRCDFCLPSGDFRDPTSVVWSPDSNKFAFATWYAEPTGIYIYDMNLRSFRLFREFLYLTYVGIPSWSPDGTLLSIIWHNGILETYDVVSGNRVNSMSGSYSGDIGVSWSPSGAYLTVNRRGVNIIDANSNEITHLTPEQSNIINDDSIYFRTIPQWLPDESSLIVEGVTYGVGGSWYIYSIDITTLEKRRLAEGTEPQLSPDGEWIVFIGRGELENDIYIMRSDGTDLQQITDTNATELFPQWGQ